MYISPSLSRLILALDFYGTAAAHPCASSSTASQSASKPNRRSEIRFPSRRAKAARRPDRAPARGPIRSGSVCPKRRQALRSHTSGPRAPTASDFADAGSNLSLTSDPTLQFGYARLPICIGPAWSSLGFRMFQGGSQSSIVRITAVNRSSSGNPLRNQEKYCPPFALIVEPLMNPASSETRNATQRAISSGSPNRPAGI